MIRKEDYWISKEINCPNCKKLLNAFGDKVGQKITKSPDPGDLSICTGCLSALVITEHGGLRIAAQRETEGLEEELTQMRLDILLANRGRPWT